MSKAILQKAKLIRLLCLDVDGTLTDGSLHFYRGAVGRSFSVYDGLGIKRFIQHIGAVAIITAAADAEGGDDIRLRAQYLGIRHIYSGIDDKLTVLKQILSAESLSLAQVAYVGDDLPDRAAMQAVGLACAPPTAVADIKAVADYTTDRTAGQGAVREVCDMILTSQGFS